MKSLLDQIEDNAVRDFYLNKKLPVRKKPRIIRKKKRKWVSYLDYVKQIEEKEKDIISTVYKRYFRHFSRIKTPPVNAKVRRKLSSTRSIRSPVCARERNNQSSVIDSPDGMMHYDIPTTPFIAQNFRNYTGKIENFQLSPGLRWTQNLRISKFPKSKVPIELESLYKSPSKQSKKLGRAV
ncbi:unnamed protein product [Moneuplotes crassus]|uniref:Uncharacterized protein n=1 Tax=Euplotes crassus TaxID=5936 RepID=A0AAD2D5T7_EUPCR|nr:unnamed protein product [Moneuplotes crassus]